MDLTGSTSVGVGDVAIAVSCVHAAETDVKSQPDGQTVGVDMMLFDSPHGLRNSQPKILRLEPGDLMICEGGEPGRAAIWRGELTECYFQKA
ncbi:hypothetical protein BH23ACI1_BH23ACI1_14210 [soil metagenome]